MKSRRFQFWITTFPAWVGMCLGIWATVMGEVRESRSHHEKFHGVLHFKLDREKRHLSAKTANSNASPAWSIIRLPERCRVVFPHRFYNDELLDGHSYGALEDCLSIWILGLSRKSGSGIRELEGMVFPIFVSTNYSALGEARMANHQYHMTVQWRTTTGTSAEATSLGQFYIRSISYNREMTAEEISDPEKVVNDKWEEMLEIMFPTKKE